MFFNSYKLFLHSPFYSNLAFSYKATKQEDLFMNCLLAKPKRLLISVILVSLHQFTTVSIVVGSTEMPSLVIIYLWKTIQSSQNSHLSKCLKTTPKYSLCFFVVLKYTKMLTPNRMVNQLMKGWKSWFIKIVKATRTLVNPRCITTDKNPSRSSYKNPQLDW